jgi:hypothetical protein
MSIDDLKAQQAMIEDARARVRALERGRDAGMADLWDRGVVTYSDLAVDLDLDINDVQERISLVFEAQRQGKALWDLP